MHSANLMQGLLGGVADLLKITVAWPAACLCHERAGCRAEIIPT